MQMSVKELNEIFNNPEAPLSVGDENRLIRQAKSGNLESRSAIIQNRLESVVHLSIIQISKHELQPRNEPMNMDLVNTMIFAGKIGVDMAIDEYVLGGGSNFKSFCQDYITMSLNFRLNEMVYS